MSDCDWDATEFGTVFLNVLLDFRVDGFGYSHKKVRVFDSVLLARLQARDIVVPGTSVSNLKWLLRGAAEYPLPWILAGVGFPALWLRGHRLLLLPCVACEPAPPRGKATRARVGQLPDFAPRGEWEG